MTETRSLKQRLHAKEGINIAFATLTMSEAELAERLGQDEYDMVHIDAQHTPVTGAELVRFCQMANALGVPPQIRIRHTREAYLIGRYLDFGLLSVVVPQVETEATGLRAPAPLADGPVHVPAHVLVGEDVPQIAKSLFHFRPKFLANLP